MWGLLLVGSGNAGAWPAPPALSRSGYPATSLLIGSTRSNGRDRRTADLGEVGAAQDHARGLDADGHALEGAVAGLDE